MHPIRMENDKGQCVGLLLQHTAKDIMNEQQLIKLKPFVQNLLRASSNDALKIAKISNTQAVYVVEGANAGQLSSICDLCRKMISEQLIVPQQMDVGPWIRHRVMQFDIENSQLVVKYVTLGDSNSFDYALSHLALIFKV